MDGEFESLRGAFADLGIKMNCVSKGEYVPKLSDKFELSRNEQEVFTTLFHSKLFQPA